MKVYTMRPHIAIFLVGLMLLLRPATGHCWGDEGHEIVGLIAEHYLEPAVRARVIALLAQDASGLTRGTGIAEETTWADKFRDSDRDIRLGPAWSPPEVRSRRPNPNALPAVRFAPCAI